MGDGNGCDGGVRQTDRFPLFGVVSFQSTGELCDLPCDRVVVQSSQEALCLFLLIGAQASVDLGHVYRATRQQVALMKQFFQEIWTIPFSIQQVNNDACVEKIDRHLLRGFLQAALIELALFGNPSSGSLFKFRMILVFP
jgi:hypothetical protein